MILSAQQKQSLKNSLVSSLCREEEIRRIVIFGSFVRSDCPEDMDVAVFQDSDAPYEVPRSHPRCVQADSAGHHPAAT